MGAVYLDHEFFGDGRFGLAALKLSEHPFTTEMRVVRCWRHCYSNLTPRLPTRDIVVQAQWPGEPELLIGAFVDVGIMDPSDDGTFEFHGAADRIAIILKSVESGREGGLRSGRARRAKAHEAARKDRTTPAGSLEGPFTPPQGTLKGPSRDPQGTLNHRTDGLPDHIGDLKVSPPDCAGGDVSPPPPKPKRPRPDPKPVEPDDIALAEAWAEYAREVSTTVKPDVLAWAQVVRQLREIDGLTHEDVRALLAFVRFDHFWQMQSASLPGMRHRAKNGLLKFENARAAMRGAQATAGISPDRQREIDAAVAAVFSEGIPDAQ